MIYAFVQDPMPVDFGSADGVFKAYRLLREKVGYKNLNRDEKRFVSDFFNEMWHPEAYASGVYKSVGWAVDFRPFMRRFLIHERHYGWREVWSFNKTTLRRNAMRPRDILEIVEVPRKEHVA